MKETVTKFPERLIVLREQNGMTRQQLADVLGISRASLEYYEKGQRTPDINMLYRLSEYFNISADYMLGRTQREGKTNTINEASKYTGLSVQAINKLHKCNEQAKKQEKKETTKSEFAELPLSAKVYPYGSALNIFNLPKPNNEKMFIHTLNELITNQNEIFLKSLIDLRVCVLNAEIENKELSGLFLARLSTDIQDIISALSNKRWS